MADPLRALSEILGSCDSACTSAFRELDDPNYSISEGDAWNTWVGQLSDLISAGRLPTSINRARGRPAPFVCLISELQTQLPLECRRHTHSVAALTKAIGRSR
jgi:hypothetical protein